MNNRYVLGYLLAGSLALSASAIALAVAAPAPAPNAPRGAAAAPPPLEILDFKPGFDDLMTMLIQPRHIKLYLAGQQKNWTLAAFELNELRNALLRIGQTIPKYQNFSVDATTGSIFQPKMVALSGAITAQNPARFETAFRDLTEACNICHDGMGHGFLVIKVPDASAAALYPNQSFAPPPAAPAR